uniref:DLG associated protein 4 n=1 Tax=Latimeria chalumnae TaxID=7897 RepID=H3B4H7_LATCH
MKGLGVNRSRHLSDNCEPPLDAMYPTQDRNPYLLSPTDSYQLDPRFTAQNSIHGDCLLPLNNQISNSSTFPRIHYNSHYDVPDDCPFPPHPAATTATTATAPGKINRLPANLLDQFEKQLPIHRDGFSTLQFQRSDSKHRSESPGRIRHLVHSVQKLFAKSQSLEANSKGNVNGKFGTDDSKQSRRSKSKDRAKTESKRRSRSNMSGWWSSDDNLDSDNFSHRNPMSLMTLGRRPDHGPNKYFMHAYNTISEHTLKASKSNNDLKCSPCVNIPINADSKYIKRGSWSTLTLSHAREVCQKSSATIDKALLKSKSCHQDLSCHYLQVPQGEWNSTLSRDKGGEIPCRRMRSGSYIKAMGDEDSEDSETSPKPSPKTAARRQSYLKATQQSLGEQSTVRRTARHQPRTVVKASKLKEKIKEITLSRSLDNLDSIEIPSSPKFQRWEEGYSRTSNTISQVREVELNSQYETVCESVFSEMETQAVEALDLPLPSCFRSRSHSYLRAIQAGCSQDDDSVSVRSVSPPPSSTTVRTIHTTTTSTCITAYKKPPPPVPPRTTSKPFISVTVQSSTESAQDTYLDNQDHKSEINSQSGLSNSSDSLDSTRTHSTTRGPIVSVLQDPPIDTQQKYATLKSDKGTITSEEPRPDPLPKRKLSSIGIQVDCIQPAPKEEPLPITKFQSIGVQVEEEWHFFRASRSSSMTSKQETDLDTQEVSNFSIKSLDKSSSDFLQRHHNSSSMDSASVRYHTKSSQTKSKSFPYTDSMDPALDPSSLPPPDPWLESSNGSPVETIQSNTCRRDGRWFLKLLQAETERMEGWCHQMDKETKENHLSEEVLGKVRSAVGSAQLLMSQKFQQFRGLCEQNLNPSANPRPTAQDLAGFWDLLQLSIEDISMKFDELYHLKANEWQLPDTPEKKLNPTLLAVLGRIVIRQEPQSMPIPEKPWLSTVWPEHPYL